jgi:hypothetical protein
MSSVAQVSVNWQRPSFEVTRSRPMLRAASAEEPVVHGQRPQVRIESDGPYLSLDNSATRETVGLRSNDQFRRFRLESYRGAAQRAIDKIVREGHRLGRINTGEENAIANLAWEDTAYAEPVALTLVALPGPDVHITPKSVSVSWGTEGGPTGLVMRKPEFEWTPARSKIDWQLSNAEIGFVGGRLDATA